jgi:hypothetical protein
MISGQPKRMKLEEEEESDDDKMEKEMSKIGNSIILKHSPCIFQSGWL